MHAASVRADFNLGPSEISEFGCTKSSDGGALVQGLHSTPEYMSARFVSLIALPLPFDAIL